MGRTPPSNFDSQGDMREAGRGVPWQALAYLMTGYTAYLEGARKWMLAICEFPRWENNRSLAAGECLFGVATGYDWLNDRLNTKEQGFIREKLVRQTRALKDGPPVHHDRWLANHNHVEHLGLTAAGFALFDEVPEAIVRMAVAHRCGHRQRDGPPVCGTERECSHGCSFSAARRA